MFPGARVLQLCYNEARVYTTVRRAKQRVYTCICDNGCNSCPVNRSFKQSAWMLGCSHLVRNHLWRVTIVDAFFLPLPFARQVSVHLNRTSSKKYNRTSRKNKSKSTPMLSQGNRKNKSTVGYQFRLSLDLLMKKIKTAEPHFIR